MRGAQGSLLGCFRPGLKQPYNGMLYNGAIAAHLGGTTKRRYDMNDVELTYDQGLQYIARKAQWVEAAKALREAVGEAVTWRASDAEQAAWDVWVDWVEAEGLNYTHYDPRGPENSENNPGVLGWVR